MQQSQQALLTLDKFKIFSRNNLKDFDAFVGHIWTKLKRDI